MRCIEQPQAQNLGPGGGSQLHRFIRFIINTVISHFQRLHHTHTHTHTHLAMNSMCARELVTVTGWIKISAHCALAGQAASSAARFPFACRHCLHMGSCMSLDTLAFCCFRSSLSHGVSVANLVRTLIFCQTQTVMHISICLPGV